MVALHTTFTAFICTLTISNAVNRNPLSDDFINLINTKQTSWKAGRNFPLHTSLTYIKKLMGTLNDDTLAKLPQIKHNAEVMWSLPENLDLRDKWPDCPSLNEIRDQGACGSCWALAAVEAMTDRYCIHSKGTQQFHFSAEDLISCCETCGLGCIRGVHAAAWEYWKHIGLVSGGNYNSSQGCRPYKIPPGENNIIGELQRFAHVVDISECVTSCDSSYNTDYDNDKRRGKNVYSIGRNETHIKAELLKNGPVEGVMAVYTDFLNYKHGIYNYTVGHFLGYHAVKIIGWGIENGLKYWLAANSWNQDWGNKGFFKILRGDNHCGIESSIVAGEPLIY